MVNISAFPKCWIDDIINGTISLTQWIDIASGLSCDGLELYSRFLSSTDDKYLNNIREYAGKFNLQLPMMCYSPDFTKDDPILREKEIKNLKQMIQVTAKLGGNYCRILSGQARPFIDKAKGVKYVVESVKKCLETAEEFAVILVMENHYKDEYWEYPEFALKVDLFLEILEKLDSPFVGVQYDPSNALIAGYDPIKLLNQVIGRVKTVHASDRFIKHGYSVEDILMTEPHIGYAKYLQHGVTGKGMIDYHAIFSRLKEAEFSGWVSIEDGMNGFKEMEQSIQFLKKMRRQYFGY